MREGREHGGSIDVAAARYGIAPDQWLDLSTGINPHPYPVPPIDAARWQALPDRGLDLRLRTAAAERYGVADPAHVVAAAGSQAVIQWLPRLIHPARVDVVSPTYNEHAAAWEAAGHLVREVMAPDDAAADGAILVVTHPNNPDGRRWPREDLLAMTDDRLVVVDEAFADAVPSLSLAPHAGRSGLVVIRSIGKFYGLAGMRLGFALAEADLADALTQAMGPWPVSGPTAEAGIAALGDPAWAEATRVRLQKDADRLDSLLAAHDCLGLGGTTLFRLVEHGQAHALAGHLASAAILVRTFSASDRWLRFGVPDEAGFDRLATALAAWKRIPPRVARARR